MPQAHCVLFAVGTIENYQLTAKDCFYICLPLFHANGLFMQLLACLLCGCKAVIRNRFSATRWLSDLRWLNNDLQDRRFICGDRFTLADIHLYAFLNFGAKVAQPLNFKLKNVHTWFTRISERDSTQA